MQHVIEGTQAGTVVHIDKFSVSAGSYRTQISSIDLITESHGVNGNPLLLCLFPYLFLNLLRRLRIVVLSVRHKNQNIAFRRLCSVIGQTVYNGMEHIGSAIGFHAFRKVYQLIVGSAEGCRIHDSVIESYDRKIFILILILNETEHRLP